jgi:hypothetical protein
MLSIRIFSLSQYYTSSNAVVDCLLCLAVSVLFWQQSDHSVSYTEINILYRILKTQLKYESTLKEITYYPTPAVSITKNPMYTSVGWQGRDRFNFLFPSLLVNDFFLVPLV